MFARDARCPTAIHPQVPATRPAAFLVALLLAILSLTSISAHAQVMGTWQTAITEPPDVWKAGAFLIIGEPIGLVGQLRTGIDTNWDIGFQFGFPDFDDDTVFGIAGDTKFLLHKDSSEFPLDVSGDIAFGYQTDGDFDLVDFDLGAIGSHKITTSGGEVITPYGAIILAIGHANDDTELDVHVRPGLEWVISSTVNFLGELNLSSRDETIAISAGLMFKL